MSWLYAISRVCLYIRKSVLSVVLFFFFYRFIWLLEIFLKLNKIININQHTVFFFFFMIEG